MTRRDRITMGLCVLLCAWACGCSRAADGGGVSVEQTSAGEVRIGNGFMTMVVRKGAVGVECHHRLGDRPVKGAVLVPVAAGGDQAKAVTALRFDENTPARVLIEVTSATVGGACITSRYLLRKDTPLVEAQAGEGMGWLRVEAPSRYVVVPDIFASDLVINPAVAQQPCLRLPSENLLLQLVDGGGSIVACAWRSSAQAVRLAIAGKGDERRVAATEIGCRKDRPVSVAVLAAPGIWHAAPIKSLDSVKDTKLDWQVPFRALWRADYPRTDGIVDSWKCVLRDAKGHYEGFGIEPKKARTVWTSARNTFAYPACIEGEACLLRKTKFDSLPDIRYDDSLCAVIYPYQAIHGSPRGCFGALDVLREALRGAPEAALLGNPEVKRVDRDRWPATCFVTADYEKVFDAGEEKAKRKFLLERLDAMDQFVINIRSRMNEYLAWQKQMRGFIAKTKADKPQLAALADECDGILTQFDKLYERRKLDERKPAAARALIDRVIALIDSNEGEKDEKAKQLGRDTRTIGGNQDAAIGEFRMFTKRLRQRAGQRMAEAQEDAVFEFGREVRQRAMEMLQCAFGHESAHTD